MNFITLNDDQTQIIAAAVGPVQVRDSRGNILGELPPVWSSEEIREAAQILADEKTWHTTAEVQSHLRQRTIR